MPGAVVRFSARGAGQLVGSDEIVSSPDGWILAQFEATASGAAVVTAAVPAEGARRECLVLIDIRVAVSPVEVRLTTDGGPVIAMAALETAVEGVTNLQYAWEGGGVGPSSWGILGEIENVDSAPVASFYGGAWEGSVGFSVGVSGEFNGERVGVGSASGIVTVTQAGTDVRCQVGPLFDDEGHDIGVKAFYRFDGSPKRRYRVTIHEDGSYVAQQPGHDVVFNDIIYVGADGAEEYIQTALHRGAFPVGEYDTAVTALREQAGRRHARISLVTR